MQYFNKIVAQYSHGLHKC